MSTLIMRQIGCSRAVLVFLLSLLLTPNILAVTKNWTGGSGNWSPGNWSPAGVPAAGDPTNIVNTDGVARTVTLNTNTPALGLLNIELTGPGTAANTLVINSNFSLAAASSLFVGGHNGVSLSNGRGAVDQSAGTVTTSAGNALVLAHGVGSTGTYTLSGTGQFIAGESEHIGYEGNGTFHHSGGTNTLSAGVLIVGSAAGGVGTYNLSGTGQLTSNSSQYLADHGTGFFNQTGGSNTINGANDLVLANNVSSNGTYTLSGGALSINQSLHVGLRGIGTFTQSGGTNTINAGGGGAMVIGSIAGSSGTYNLSGTGQLVTNSFAYVGYDGTGVFNQTGGSHQIPGAFGGLQLGANATGNGTYTISGGTLTVASDVIVGYAGTGTLTIQGPSSVHVGNTLTIGPGDTVNLQGGTLRLNGYIRDGGGGFNFTSGTLQLSGNRTIGSDATIFDLFGPTPTIGPGKTVAIEGAVITVGNVNVAGGALRSLTQPIIVGNAGTSSSLTVTNGGAVSAQYADIVAGSQGSVSGTGSTLTLTDVLEIHGTSDISNGGVVTSGSGRISEGTGGGYVTTIRGAGSRWTVTNDLQLSFSGKLDIQTGGLAEVGNQLEILGGANVILNGGTLRLNTLNDPGNRLIFNSGTLQLAGNRNLGTDPIVPQVFGANPTIVTGKGLTVEQIATLSTLLTIDGGTFSAGALVNAELLDLRRGTLNLTSQEVTIASGGLFGATLDVDEDVMINVTQGITNQGLVTGDGQIGGSFINGVTGELRASAGQSLKFTGQVFSYGQIKLLGGELESTEHISTAPGSLISGNGTIIARQGFFNQGVMNFAGTTNIVGDVISNAGGRIISSGGGATVFHDDVVNNAEIRTSTNGFSVFYGAVTGSGTYTGSGTVNFEGDLKPGSSPAAISFGGDVSFGSEATLEIEIGGLTAGSQHDQITIAGDLALAGALEVMLINSFNPIAGQTFNILDWVGTRSGTFSSLALPTLGGGLSWSTSQLYTSGVLSVTAIGIPGDYNLDGAVNAADYTVWRDTLGSTTNIAANGNGNTVIDTGDYTVWRQNFGAPLGSGSGAASSSTAVPEPSSIVLALFGIGLASITAGRRSG